MDETEKLIDQLFEKYPDAEIEKCFGMYYVELPCDKDFVGRTIGEAIKRALEDYAF